MTDRSPFGDGKVDLSDIMAANSTYPIVQSYYYSPFGEIWQGEKPNDTNPFRYAGEYLDKETGNIYLRARYYSPTTGRFLSIDPIKDGTNWYVYCGNNPIKFVDLTGLSGIMADGSYYITHPLDEQLLKLKHEYETATPERQAEIAIEAQEIRNNNKGGVSWSVESFKPLKYYLIDTDVTSKLNKVMEEANQQYENHPAIVYNQQTTFVVSLYMQFATLVMPGGVYDLKSKPEWQGREHYIYEGEVIWFDEPGNMMYGYLGKIFGFDDHVLCAAAGMVQIATLTSKWEYMNSFFDDPRDQKSIIKGIEKYRSDSNN